MTISTFFGPTRWLSNFWPSPIVYREHRFSTVEEAYQWEKCSTAEGKHAVMYSRSPGSAKHVAKSFPKRWDWDEVKLGVMAELLRLKFMIPDLREKLLATGDEDLIEGNTWGDTYWGVCRGIGQNHLGILLMELRSSLRAEALT